MTANLLHNGGGAERNHILRSRLQNAPAPPVTVGHMRLKALDANVHRPDTKPASDIMPTGQADPPIEWCTRVLKQISIHYLSHNDVSDNEIRKFIGNHTAQHFKEIRNGSFKTYLKSTLQNSMFGTGENSWLMNFISSEVQLEDYKVAAFNLFRQSLILDMRVDGQSEESYQDARHQATLCRELSDHMMDNAIKVYDDEIEAISNGSRSPFRFGERRVQKNDLDCINAVQEELERLSAIRNGLQGYVRHEIVESSTAPDLAHITTLRVMEHIPDEKVPYAMRSPRTRRRFWFYRLNKEVRTTYCRAHLRYVEIAQMENQAWKKKIGQQFGFNCDLAFFTIIEPRLENESLKLVENLSLRVSLRHQTEVSWYFAEMQNYFQKYKEQGLNGPTPLPTFDDILVKSDDTIDKA